MKAFLTILFSSLILHAAAQQPQVRYHNITNREAARLMLSDQVVVLDVRTPEEFAQGHLKNARLLNFYDKSFAEQLDKLDKNKTYLVYCHAGGRSAQAAQMMIDKGFTAVYHLPEGFSKWDGPVER